MQYTGKRSLNEYKNMHFSLHHTRVVRAIVSGLVSIFSVCVCVGGGGGRGLLYDWRAQINNEAIC